MKWSGFDKSRSTFNVKFRDLHPKREEMDELLLIYILRQKNPGFECRFCSNGLRSVGNFKAGA